MKPEYFVTLINNCQSLKQKLHVDIDLFLLPLLEHAHVYTHTIQFMYL